MKFESSQRSQIQKSLPSAGFLLFCPPPSFAHSALAAKTPAVEIIQQRQI